MSFDIEELKINLFTNIKNAQMRTIEFKRSMLYHPELDSISEILNEYPYFTSDVKYPLSRLRYLTYKERVIFFFNKEKFSERLYAYSNEEDILDKTSIETEEEEAQYYKQRDKNIEKNVMTMIEILFPTKFPVINDTHTSFDIVLGRSKLKRMVLNPIITKYFSYLKIGGDVYTFKKTIWINDMLNHPVYQNLIAQYRKFWIWASEEKYKLTRLMDNNFNNVINEINNIFEKVNSFKFSNINGKKDFTIEIFGKYLNNFYILKRLIGVNKETLLSFAKSCGLNVNLIELKNIIGKKTETNKRKKKNKNAEPNADVNTDEVRIKLMKKIQNNILESIETEPNIDSKKNYNEIIENLKKLDNLCIGDVEYPCGKFSQNSTVKQFIRAVETYDFIELFFNKKFDYISQVSSDKGIQVPPQYRNFAYSVLGLYRKPARESSNAELQELINGDDVENVTRFYKFMDYLYNKYIYAGVKKPPASSDSLNELMNVGLSYLNISTTEGVRREVYVYADFILGEVNDKNMSKIFCPYVSDHLGNEFDFLVRMALYDKIGKKDAKQWNIDRNRMIFSMKENTSAGSKDSEKTLELEAKPLEKLNEENPLLLPEQVQFKNIDRLQGYFISTIISNYRDVTDKMKAVNEVSPVDNLDDQTLLPFIKKNESELYDIIAEWNENIEKRNGKLIEKMINLQSKYEGQKKYHDYSKTNDFLVNKDTEKVKKLIYMISKYDLYSTILSYLIKNEQSKQQVLGGFTRRRKKISKTNTNTRRRKL
jgi:hypothetical protein